MRKRSGSDEIREIRVVAKSTRTDGSDNSEKQELLKPDRRSRTRPRKGEPTKKRVHKRVASSRSLASHDSKVKDRPERTSGSTESSEDLVDSSQSSTSSTDDDPPNSCSNIITARDISQAIVDFCFEKTMSTRKYMEENPDEQQPKDFRLYPGKVAPHSKRKAHFVCRLTIRFVL
jgi:hypothetical protein